MATVEEHVPPLEAGARLTRAQFLRRWEAMPNLQKAELIGGIVYLPPPLSRAHAIAHGHIVGWLEVYAALTPGCEPADNGTWLMGKEDTPQPDATMRLLPEYGGQSRVSGLYPSGAPEFLAEVCLSSTSYDLHPELDLYEKMGVQEYLAVLLYENELRWHILENEAFQLAPAPADGIYRSRIFPGLWLHAPALLDGDMAQVLATLQEGLHNSEHAAFVSRLKNHTASSSREASF